MLENNPFDFGFTAVDEDDLDISKEAEAAMAAASQHEDKLNRLYEAILPLLHNLKKNPEKDYIKWPNRVKKVEEYDNGVWRAERIEKGESWTFDGSSLIHREREHGALQTSTFTDADGDGIFTRVDRSGSALLGGSGPLGL